LVAAIREEVRASGTDANTLEQFLVDAVTLEENYKTMIATLVTRGTKSCGTAATTTRPCSARSRTSA
jgi:hypothetical protein